MTRFYKSLSNALPSNELRFFCIEDPDDVEMPILLYGATNLWGPWTTIKNDEWDYEYGDGFRFVNQAKVKVESLTGFLIPDSEWRLNPLCLPHSF